MYRQECMQGVQSSNAGSRFAKAALGRVLVEACQERLCTYACTIILEACTAADNTLLALAWPQRKTGKEMEGRACTHVPAEGKRHGGGNEKEP